MGTRRKPLSRTQNHFLPVLNSLPDNILFQWTLRDLDMFWSLFYLHYDTGGVFPMMSELGYGNDYRDQKKVTESCAPKGTLDLMNSLESLMIPFWQGTSGKISKDLGYGNRKERRRAVNQRVKEFEKLDQSSVNSSESSFGFSPVAGKYSLSAAPIAETA